MDFTADPNKIRKDLADRSHSGTSFDPEKRAEQEIQAFVAHVQAVYEKIKPYAKSEEQKTFLLSEMQRFQSGYAAKYNEYLSSHGRIVSSFIAGPSNFPARQMNKRQSALENKRSDMDEYSDKAQAAILRELKKMAVSEAGGEVEVLKQKIADAEKNQEDMKAANVILRSKVSDEDKIRQLLSLGFSDEQAHKLLKPDFAGRIGYSYHLQNNLANIKRMKERIGELEKKEATPSGDIPFEGGTMHDSKEDDRIQLFFDQKPPQAMIDKLKSEGWRWSPAMHAWQRKRTDNALFSARRILGLEQQNPIFVTPKQGLIKEELRPTESKISVTEKQVSVPTEELPIALKIIKEHFDTWYSHGDTLDSPYAPDMVGQAVSRTSYGKDLQRLLSDLKKIGYKDLRDWYLSVNPRAIGMTDKFAEIQAQMQRDKDKIQKARIRKENEELLLKEQEKKRKALEIEAKERAGYEFELNKLPEPLKREIEKVTALVLNVGKEDRSYADRYTIALGKMNDYIKRYVQPKKEEQIFAPTQKKLFQGETKEEQTSQVQFKAPIAEGKPKPLMSREEKYRKERVKEAPKKREYGLGAFGVQTSIKGLSEFEEKPVHELERYQKPERKPIVPASREQILKGLKSPPNPFIQPKPKLLLAMQDEKALQEAKRKVENSLLSRLDAIAEKTRLKREAEKLRQEVE